MILNTLANEILYQCSNCGKIERTRAEAEEALKIKTEVRNHDTENNQN